ncbi:uncharacterized protein LOC129601285 [Paramacrobiotus metropolitanus]|uniref:uncharacterized protein LOC129601285 n=1 Tax=Paramacrobiotus metropolitanus TaxID=2943436 RepID=UPI00244659E3|nr:uncharacterized protein LOC129601285 [Paramacrobiotus metropolitanus]XP_055356035.1 uncharacterized protein LOC129601285 [Paramacrobiotus metropolitanus]
MQHDVHSLRPIPHMPGLMMATMSLSVRYFPWSATGSLVECAQACGRLQETPTTLRDNFCTYSYQIFQLVVLPTAGQLFIHPLANATVQRLSDASFECAANTLPNQPVAFIWRFNGHVISAPADHPLFALARTRLLRRQEQPRLAAQRFPLFGISSAEQFVFSVTANISTNTASSTLTISQVDLHTSARVECWVRPNADADTWRVQAAYLHVYKITSTG